MMRARIISSVLTASAVALSVCLCGCEREGGFDSRDVKSPHDLVGRTVGAVTGSTIQLRTERYQPGLNYMSFNDYVSAVEALRRGKIDAMPLEKMMADVWVAQFPGEFRLSDIYIRNDMGYFFAKGSPLRDKVDQILTRLHASGEIDRLYDKWCKSGHPENCRLEEWPREGFTGKAGKIKFANDGAHEPSVFTTPDGIRGFDIDVVSRIAIELDMELEVVQVALPSLVVSVQSGKADFGGGMISITEERKKLVDYTQPTVRGGYVLLLRTGRANGSGAFLSSLKESFVRTFVTEGRWRMLASGYGITLLITFLAAVFGTLLAFPVWLARTSRLRTISALAKSYIALMQGTPLVVFLMVLYYLVFGQVDINGVWVAVLGFSLNASAYIGEMLRSGVNSVPYGQTEAALALGYGRKRAFCRFVLPQAIRATLPVYRGQLISMFKNTSIVGYIAINDLTKASDLVRSRTYESFFPILTTAFIYFLTAWLLAFALEKLGKSIGGVK